MYVFLSLEFLAPLTLRHISNMHKADSTMNETTS
jgi:hypothetical protein